MGDGAMFMILLVMAIILLFTYIILPILTLNMSDGATTIITVIVIIGMIFIIFLILGFEPNVKETVTA